MSGELYNQASACSKKHLYSVKEGKHSSLHRIDPDFFTSVTEFLRESVLPTSSANPTEQEDGPKFSAKSYD